MRGFNFLVPRHALLNMPCADRAGQQSAVSGGAQAPSSSDCHYQDALFDIMVTARFHGERKGNIEVAPLVYHVVPFGV
jgi:hypothetical protein